MSRNIENKPGHNKADFYTIHDQTPDYAATSALVFEGVSENRVKYAQLTGAMTINGTVSDLELWDKVVIMFETDATQRIVTFGTNFLASGTLTIPASKTATVVGYFDGTNVRITSREITA